ncbi:MAG TPA: hypothetical protein VMP08_22520 [Anaerolineae bacterium]|nr:hypothetical protein [Anaerolineae bacterium]
MFRKPLIIIVLLLLVAFGVNNSAQADGTPTPDQTMDTGGTDHGPRIDANGAAVKIVAPQNGDVLRQPLVIVRVETTNWPLDEDGYHFHLYVNGKDQGIPLDRSSAIQARDLLPGDNTIEVVLSNAQHQELNATDKIIVRFDASSPAAAAPSLSTGVVFVLLGVAVVVVAVLGVGYAVMRKRTG